MARSSRRRESHRTVVDPGDSDRLARVELLIPIESIEPAHPRDGVGRTHPVTPGVPVRSGGGNRRSNGPERPAPDRAVLARLGRRFGPVDRYPATGLRRSGASVSVVVDGFAWVLYSGSADGGADDWETTGTHDGPEFAAIAQDSGVEVYLTVGIDVRRASLDDLDAAATHGLVRGGSVDAFAVESIDP